MSWDVSIHDEHEVTNLHKEDDEVVQEED